MSNIRGRTVAMIDLGLALGHPPMPTTEGTFVIVAEFNRSVQGFLVRAVDRILNIHWSEVLPPPKGMDRHGYMTAVTKLNDALVEIVDVEKVLVESVGTNDEVSAEVTASVGEEPSRGINRVLLADDSMVARRQVQRALQQVGVECVMVRDGREAFEQLKAWAEDGSLDQQIDMVISDIEMPEMDGYTLTTEIRRNPQLKHLHVMLHSSLSGVFNNAAVKKVGADDWLPKFHPDELAEKVLAIIRKRAVAA
jgi:two-component system chemotaxis response regulator CheV